MVAKPLIKNPEEIEKMRNAGQIVSNALKLVEEMIKPGISTLELDQAVEELIRSNGGEPAFKGYPSSTPGVSFFPGSICASINEEVVHGIPSATRCLKIGDILSLDVGVKKDDFFGDAARTFSVGEPSRKVKKLLAAGTQALRDAIAVIKPGATLSSVSRAIQECVEGRKFSVVKKFVGHGIGRAMHEPPQVPNFVSRGFPGRSVILETGMVLAIEPMVNAGVSDVEVLADGWTVVTRDRKLSVHFEDSVAVGDETATVLTA